VVDPGKKVPDLNCEVQDLLLEVVDLKQEMPDLRSGGILPNLTPAFSPMAVQAYYLLEIVGKFSVKILHFGPSNSYVNVICSP